MLPLPYSGVPRRRMLSAAAAALLLASIVLPSVAAATAPTAASSATGPVRAAAAVRSYAATIADARAAVAVLMKDPAVSSISVALVDGDRIAWQQGFGYADRVAGTLPVPTTMYGIGSVSKVFAAMAVMTLVDAGRVSLDAPVIRYIPDFTMASPDYRRITVRMLLDHSAGLPGTDYRNWSMDAPFPGYADQLLATLRTERLKTTPGSMSVYCNDCFTLAQILVDRVSGMSYPDYVTSAILAPLGMAHSRYSTAEFVPGTAARVYDPATATMVPREYLGLYGSGGLFSTPSDMARVASMLMDGGTYAGRRVLSAEAVAEMGRDQTKGSLDPTGLQGFIYGLGWDTVREPGLAKVGVTAWYKSGGTNDYVAGFLVVPGERLAVVIESTEPMDHAIDAETLAQRIALHALAERGSIAAMPKALGATTLALRTPTVAQLDAIAGTYLGEGRGYRVTVRPDRTLAFASLVDGAWATATSTYTLRTDGAFWTSGVPAKSVRAVSAWGRTYLVFRSPGGVGHYVIDIPLGERIDPGAPLSAAWRARAGHTWLMANESPDSRAWALGPSVRLTEIPGLPGYLDVGYYEAPAPVDVGGSDTLGSMFLVVPTAFGRDLEDLSVEARGGEEWLHWGGTVLRPQATVPGLTSGPGSVSIGPEGYAEWRTVTAALAVTTSGAGAWKVLDANLALVAAGAADATAAPVPAGGYVVLFGDPGDVIGIRTR